MLTGTLNTAMSHMPTMSPPWALYSWPVVFWQAEVKKRPRFIHLSTKVTSGRTSPMLCCGTTLWGQFSKEGDAGLAWEWVEIAQGVVAMADPMSLSTNLRLLAVNGDLLSSTLASQHFNRYVHRLPWQREVYRALRSA
jgi:hypothetical protein